MRISAANNVCQCNPSWQEGLSHRIKMTNSIQWVGARNLNCGNGRNSVGQKTWKVAKDESSSQCFASESIWKIMLVLEAQYVNGGHGSRD